ncbi:MAG: ABC transporter permease [Candidatus Dojkabacteria bacterium]|uniref:ABC transporter permease n=1 Tax=Candidatus Dojkabacteria bacterium TaxID=2099670 RepID=A0A952AHI6_9BACT|nr:ABC transporter permease [Candidatus Dojkabacteria bacterium]WKZ28267.1 MAG: ABC transporter permease [Candidatus Dojkabacteria bacterium]
MNKLFVVAKYEYLKTIKRKAFWFATLFTPVLIGLLMVISTISSIEGSKKLEELNEEINQITVVDEATIINENLYNEILDSEQNLDAALDRLQKNETDIVLYFPDNILETNSYKIFTNNDELFQTLGYSTYGSSLINQSALITVNDPQLISLLTQNFEPETIVVRDNGVQDNIGLERLIIPGFSMLIFFLSVFISGQYMLQSVAEEKENRMIENLLSIVSARSLIFGKLLGLSGAVFTQLALWASLSILFLAIGNSESISSAISISSLPWQTVPINLVFILLGFLFFAAVMTGVGGVGTSYKDSQSLSSIFVILSVLPIYFITILISDPNGVVAQIASYFPFTSAMMFVLRNSISELSALEILVGVTINIIYVLIAGVLAEKLFKLGAIMYNRKPKIGEILHVLKSN